MTQFVDPIAVSPPTTSFVPVPSAAEKHPSTPLTLVHKHLVPLFDPCLSILYGFFLPVPIDFLIRKYAGRK